MTGRGLLGRFGPNHAADPVISKWKRDATGTVVKDKAGLPVLQFVAVKRLDTGDWAIPGGMVSPGENVSVTLKREFGEETMNSLEMTPEDAAALKNRLDQLFRRGVPVYSGYVDDIRNTDNAWMETVAVNFHDEVGDAFGEFKLAAGDDAGDVAWTDYTPDITLYATHGLFLKIIHRMRTSKPTSVVK